MDLKGNKIMMSDLLADKRAKEIIMDEFPQMQNPVLLSMAKHMTLAEVIKRTAGHVPKSKVDAAVEMLKKL